MNVSKYCSVLIRYNVVQYKNVHEYCSVLIFINLVQ